MKKFGMSLVALLVSLTCLIIPVSAESTVSDTDEVQTIFNEINQYMESHKELTTISYPGLEQTKYAEIPLSNGETATLTVVNQKVGISPMWQEDWDTFNYTNYSFYYTYDIPAICSYTHRVYYTLSRVSYPDSVGIKFTNATFSVVPSAVITVSSKDVDWENPDVLSGSSRAYATLAPVVDPYGISYNLYSDIDMTNTGGLDEGAIITVTYNYSFL